MKRLVRDLIRQRGLNIFTSVAPDTSIFEALNILEKSRSSAILVIKDSFLKGIFSEKDFACTSRSRNIQMSARVDSIMTTKVYYVDSYFTLEECLMVMTKTEVNHLPVIENGIPIALLNIRNIMEVLVEDKDSQIRELTTYILGVSLTSEFNQDHKNQKIPIYYLTQSQEAL